SMTKAASGRPKKKRRSRLPSAPSTSAKGTRTTRPRASGTTASSRRPIRAGCWAWRFRPRSTRPSRTPASACSACRPRPGAALAGRRSRLRAPPTRLLQSRSIAEVNEEFDWMTPMFDTLLIANRGEIACRVAATARRLGIRTVAVYSDADAGARHVAACDVAVHIGGPEPRASYLRGDAILEAARATGAQAIHPGYGFLSENEAFAQAAAAAGIAFVGPPASAIAATGSKSAAKALMEKAGVPLVPGYHGDNQDPQFLKSQADAIGYPVLIKASAGGGGKGMRVV